ncbi:GntR family transcriptional regulator [Caldicellulosiruptor morganii]|uniref:GntR family transcriptional regulator n=1 Tax=Caldicellulosiruptor morganii TaxID=1387555 RepID=A0ABY7BQZ8_9FIRM|nr:GntR family transcriptional regulator [Caldicellulosiruptor morganii]WAM33481.1 GntR family transcriptional regulator [Caldicellulosiruptor morganii]
MKIAEELRKEIEEKYEEGERIPSELELCDRFGATRYVIRKALSRLVQMGLIYPKHGKGYFVVKKPLYVRYWLSPVSRFSKMMKDMGYIPHAKLIKAGETNPPNEVKEKLELSSEELVYQLEILRFANNLPLAYSYTWLPTEKFHNLLYHINSFFSLYEIIENVYNIKPFRMNSIIQVVYPTDKESYHLKISGSIPLLQITSIVRDEKNRKIEFTKSKYRSDLCRVEIDFRDVGGCIK